MTLVAITVAAFSSGGWYWTKILFTIALAVKLWAVLAFLLLRGRKRAFWIGVCFVFMGGLADCQFAAFGFRGIPIFFPRVCKSVAPFRRKKFP